jgi:hypothetical protein
VRRSRCSAGPVKHGNGSRGGANSVEIVARWQLARPLGNPICHIMIDARICRCQCMSILPRTAGLSAGPTGFGLPLPAALDGGGLRRGGAVAGATLARDRVKTDRRDSRRLARLHRAGELIVMRVPTGRKSGPRPVSGPRRHGIADGAAAGTACRSGRRVRLRSWSAAGASCSGATRAGGNRSGTDESNWTHGC